MLESSKPSLQWVCLYPDIFCNMLCNMLCKSFTFFHDDMFSDRTNLWRRCGESAASIKELISNTEMC